MDFWIEKLSSVIIDLPATVMLNEILKFSKVLFKKYDNQTLIIATKKN